MNENQFTWRSSQNFTLWVIINLPFLNLISDLCLVIHKSNFNNYKIVKTRAAWSLHEAEGLNHTLYTKWIRTRAGDFDLTGKCDWKRDRKCSTWRMRRRFAAVLILGCFNYGKYVIASIGKVRAHLKDSECARMFFLLRAALLIFNQSINQSINKRNLSTVVIKA